MKMYTRILIRRFFGRPLVTYLLWAGVGALLTTTLLAALGMLHQATR